MLAGRLALFGELKASRRPRFKEGRLLKMASEVVFWPPHAHKCAPNTHI